MSRMPSTSTATGSVTSRARGHLLDLDAQRVAHGRQHERHARPSTSNGTGSGGSSMPGGASPTSASVEELLDREPLVAHRLGDDRLRELLVSTSASSRSDAPSLTRSSMPGRALAQVGDERGHEPPARGADDAEAGPADLQALQRGDVLVEHLELAPDPAGVGEHDLARLGRGRARPAPGEQGDAELGLELADLLGHVRLHGPQEVRGRGERALLVDRDQGLEVAQLHGRLLSALASPGRRHAP